MRIAVIAVMLALAGSPHGSYFLMGAGALLIAIGTVGDIVTAPSAAHDDNRSHGWEPTITVAPVAMPGGAGLGLLGSF